MQQYKKGLADMNPSGFFTIGPLNPTENGPLFPTQNGPFHPTLTKYPWRNLTQ